MRAVRRALFREPPRFDIEGSEMLKLVIALAAVLTLALGVPISTTYAAEAGDTPADVATPPADAATPPADADDKASAEDQEDTSEGESKAEEKAEPE